VAGKLSVDARNTVDLHGYPAVDLRVRAAHMSCYVLGSEGTLKPN
jgi:hypothetical protein